MSFLCHTSLTKSIPHHNDNVAAARSIIHPILPYKIAILARQFNTSRLAYREFVFALSEPLVNQSKQTHIKYKWNRDIECMHEGTLKDIRQSTCNTYLQTLHYRIVNRIISTNTFLFRIGKSENPLCSIVNLDLLYHFVTINRIFQTFQVIVTFFDTIK